MTFSVGDIINIDGVDWEIDHAGPLGYWIREPGKTVTYFGLRFETKEEVKKLLDGGRLRLGKAEKIIPGPGFAWCSAHDWKKYIGIREVFDFCQNCGAKRRKDWRLLKDEKDY